MALRSIDYRPDAGRNRVTTKDNEDSVKREMALLEGISLKDQTALAELYDCYNKILFSIALQIIRDAKVAEEILQEVFLQIWEKAGSYNPRLGKPLTWAVILTRNKAIDHLRSAQRREKLLEGLAQFATSETPADSIQNDVTLQELSASVRTALQTIPAEQRTAIELAFFSGLTQSEIAARLDQPLGTIKARIRRGMLDLRQRLEQHLHVAEL